MLATNSTVVEEKNDLTQASCVCIAPLPARFMTTCAFLSLATGCDNGCLILCLHHFSPLLIYLLSSEYYFYEFHHSMSTGYLNCSSSFA